MSRLRFRHYPFVCFGASGSPLPTKQAPLLRGAVECNETEGLKPLRRLTAVSLSFTGEVVVDLDSPLRLE